MNKKVITAALLTACFAAPMTAETVIVSENFESYSNNIAPISTTGILNNREGWVLLAFGALADYTNTGFGVTNDSDTGSKVLKLSWTVGKGYYGSLVLKDYNVQLPGGNLSDYKLRFKAKGLASGGLVNTDSIGGIGAAILTSDTGNPTAARGTRYVCQQLLNEWFAFEFNLADMTPDNLGGLSADVDMTKPFLQLNFWIRSNVLNEEALWPSSGGFWAVYIDDVQLVYTGAGTGPDYGPFNEYLGTLTNGYVDTGSWMGWVYVQNFPWVWVVDLGKYVYSAGDAWFYIAK